jgi:hypothetical protein
LLLLLPSASCTAFIIIVVINKVPLLFSELTLFRDRILLTIFHIAVFAAHADRSRSLSYVPLGMVGAGCVVCLAVLDIRGPQFSKDDQNQIIRHSTRDSGGVEASYTENDRASCGLVTLSPRRPTEPAWLPRLGNFRAIFSPSSCLLYLSPLASLTFLPLRKSVYCSPSFPPSVRLSSLPAFQAPKGGSRKGRRRDVSGGVGRDGTGGDRLRKGRRGRKGGEEGRPELQRPAGRGQGRR